MNFDFDGQSRIVDVHISHLREKLEADPKRPEYLVTVRGFGYKFQSRPNEKTLWLWFMVNRSIADFFPVLASSKQFYRQQVIAQQVDFLQEKAAVF